MFVFGLASEAGLATHKLPPLHSKVLEHNVTNDDGYYDGDGGDAELYEVNHDSIISSSHYTFDVFMGWPQRGELTPPSQSPALGELQGKKKNTFNLFFTMTPSWTHGEAPLSVAMHFRLISSDSR